MIRGRGEDGGRQRATIAGAASAMVPQASGLVSNAVSVQSVRSGNFAGLQTVSTRTPEILLSRYAAPLQGQLLTLPGRKWITVEVDRPTIWRPRTIAQEEIWFAPGNGPPNGTVYTGGFGASGISASSGMPGVGGGSCLLNGPGQWALYNTGALAVDGVLLDAMDPAFASGVMNERGTAGEGFTRAVALAAGVATLILPVDRQRRAVRFQFRQTISATAEQCLYGWSNSNISSPGVAVYEVWVPGSPPAFAANEIEWSGDIQTQRALWATMPSGGSLVYTVTKN